MNLDDLILVSVDDHIIEPADLFDGRLPSRFREGAPYVEANDEGYLWVFGDSVTTTGGLNAVAGRPPEEYGIEPTQYDQMRPGCYDVHARVKDMSANGVLGSLNFPTFPRFCGQFFAEQADKHPDLALAVVRAYNDWHIEAWCGAYPERFIPCTIPPLWDSTAMAAEIRRTAEMGSHAVTFSMNPYKLGLPSFHSDYWDPFRGACDETETIVCLHIGSGSYEIQTSPDAPVGVRITCAGINIFPTAADLVWSPIFTKFKNLRFSLSEGGIGWIPYFLERIDYTYDHHGAWTGLRSLGARPSEVFLERVVTCFISDAVGIANLDRLNPDMVAWEADYPHSDGIWPDAPETTFEYLRGLSDDLIDRITHKNAMRLFSYDPFAVRGRESCTVAALRGEVTDHDVSIVSSGKTPTGPRLLTNADQQRSMVLPRRVAAP